jgi:hypothetical protein
MPLRVDIVKSHDVYAVTPEVSVLQLKSHMILLKKE